ncbi:hypothetical protein B296_00058293 [Ensete ventricosum]|uniref:Uncharacterized protein n=1 Tax=Ensete ventricosum TaxID=4639 RepID=A0A426X2J1_ENSVE|nr:hypothetical protein B296_00058293 [Ensete ventricosum]
MTMNSKKGADDSAIAKFDNLIRSNYHAPARSSSCEGRRSLPDVKETAVLSITVKLSSAADGVGKVPLLVGVDATVVVHKEDGLV